MQSSEQECEPLGLSPGPGRQDAEVQSCWEEQGAGGFAGQPSLQEVGLQGEGTELEGPWNSLEATRRPRNWDDGVEAE